jgi:hypothetical protein
MRLSLSAKRLAEDGRQTQQELCALCVSSEAGGEIIFVISVSSVRDLLFACPAIVLCDGGSVRDLFLLAAP